MQTAAVTDPASETASDTPAAAPAARGGLSLVDLIGQADALTAEGRIDRAIAIYRLALRLSPGTLGLHFNLALALLRHEHPQQAIHHFDVLLNAPDQPEWLRLRARQGLAVALEQAGNTAAAAAEYRRLLEAEPNNFAVLRQLGTLYRDLGLPERALDAFERCHTLWPAHVGIALERLRLRLALADWSAVPDAAATAALGKACLQPPAGVEAPAPHVFLQLPAVLRASILCELARAHAHAIEQANGLPKGGAQPPRPRSREGRRLHIAYAVHDIVGPATAWLRELLQAHDRERYQVSLYRWGADPDGTARDLSEGLAEQLVDVHGWSDAAIAARLREDGVDVLLDPGNPTAHSRPGVFARRPAPLQLAWLGDPLLAASGWFDALIADAHQLRDEPTPWPSPVLTLPGCARLLAMRHALEARPRPTRHDLGLPLRAPVLACFAPASALSAALFGIWVRQVAPVRGAVLWLANHPKPLRKRLAGLAIAQGLPPQRLRFLDDTVNRDDALLLADLVLDTGRDEGAATLHEALANAVPSLTLTGPTALLRIGDSLLRATACSSLIAEDLPGYESRLAHLLRHPRELMACRDRLRRQRSAPGAALAQPAVHQPGALATALQARLEALWPDHE